MNINHQEFESYLLQPFISNKIKIHIENNKCQNYFFQIAKSFQLSGHLLKSLDFSIETSSLKENFIKLNKNYVKKILLMRLEISKLAKLFDLNNIEYVVLKGMAIQIKKIDSYRQFRDLDILINKKDLKKAYKILRNSGYAYFNSKSNDDVKFVRDKHHIPPVVNNAGIIVELHHRVTLGSVYKLCPLTNIALSEKENIDGINVVSDRVLLAHSLYHGILHHELKFGPIFLLDLKNILLKNADADNSINNILNKLDLIYEYEQAKVLINECKKRKYIDDTLLINFKNFFKEGEIFPTEARSKPKKISIGRFIKSTQYLSYYYQLPYWSPKLVNLMLKKLIKKVKLGL